MQIQPQSHIQENPKGPDGAAEAENVVNSMRDILVAKFLAPSASRYPSNLALRLVQVVHRHGERTPIYANNPALTPDSNYENECIASAEAADSPNAAAAAAAAPAAAAAASDSKGVSKCAPGVLTKRGMLTMRELGAQLRATYIDANGFLPSIHDDTAALYLRSTNIQRTKDSLRYLLEGMYPATHTQAQLPDIYSRAADSHEPMFGHVGDPTAHSPRDPVYPRDRVAEEMRRQWPAALRAAADRDVFSLVLTFDNIACAAAHLKPVAGGVDKATLAQLSSFTSYLWFGELSPLADAPTQRAAAKCMIGRFVSELLELVEDVMGGQGNKISNEKYTKNKNQQQLPRAQNLREVPHQDPETPSGLAMSAAAAAADKHDDDTGISYSMHRQSAADAAADAAAPKMPKMAIYSGHDTTVAPLLGALGYWPDRWPRFRSHIILEYFEEAAAAASSTRTAKYVRAIHDDEALVLPACKDKHYPGDPTLCEYDAFMAHMSSVAAHDTDVRFAHEVAPRDAECEDRRRFFKNIAKEASR